jgi:hypothetical protein
MGLRQEHTDLTLEQVCEWCADPAVMNGALAAFDDVNELRRVPTGNGSKKKAGPRKVRTTAGRSTDTLRSATDSVPLSSPT